MRKVDFHTHSKYSDGTTTPQDIVARAKRDGVEILFLTDHDTVSGFPEARDAAKGSGVLLHCGIEINTIYQDNLHILGYGIRWEDAGFRERLEEFQGRRRLRIERMVEALRKHGLDISFDDVAGQSLETLGRPHIADLLRRKGIVQNRQEAFNRYLIKGKPGYVESMGPSAEEAIALIRDAGGFCSVAHPETVADLEALSRWTRYGLEGLEVYYSTHTPSDIVRYGRLAESLGLLCTGGTDFHGPGSGRDKALGVEVPDEVYDRFMDRLAKCF
ncbi:MAG: PHP domain-containing protein [Elusimicrobia bacterium]|nr:PHP domain-containing protein [Elusimicrobiota bacterium]